MSAENHNDTIERRKRVQALKKLVILTLLLLLAVPIVCCVILFGRVQALSAALTTVSERTEELSGLIGELQKELQSRQGNVVVTEQESSLENPKQAPAEQSMADEVNTLNDSHQHKVYLTFDDGPGRNTEEILEILERYEVKATFFVVGKEDENSQELMRDIVEGGHTLGMHSYSHKYSEIYSTVEAFEEDFTKLQDYLYEITGVKSKVYRFPGGSSNKVSRLDMSLFAAYLQEQEVTFYDWNISSGDGGSQLLDVETLVNNCLDGIEQNSTSIILLHDAEGKSTTVEALPTIIENILALENTVLLPITEDTEPVQHIQTKTNE